MSYRALGQTPPIVSSIDECPSTVSTIRSAVPRGPIELSNEDDSTIGGPNSAYWGMEPYIRTSIIDRAHDGIYDIDTAHKATLASRVKSGMVSSPHIFSNEKQHTGGKSGGGCEVRLGVEDMLYAKFRDIFYTFRQMLRVHCT